MFQGNVEFQLISAARGHGGWVGDRPQLPLAIADALVKILPVSLSDERQCELKPFLSLIFANTVETERCRQSYRSMLHSENGQPDLKIHLGSGRVPKFPNVADAALRKLHRDYRDLRRHRRVSHPCMTRFLRKLKRDPGAIGLLDMTLRSSGDRRLRLCSVPHLRRDIFNDLETAFDGALRVVEAAKKPGPSDPVFEQMARSLAALYFHFVGKRPRRGYDPIEGTDSGPFLRLCQAMGSAVTDALPAHLKKPGAVGMAKAARRMIDELKAELQAA